MSLAQFRLRPPLPSEPAATVRVLLVDDDTDYGTIVRRLLRRTVWATFEVSVIATADEAVAVDPDTYDVVLLDYQLGSRTGLDVLRWWRARGIVTPVILLTAMGGPTTDLAASEWGAFDYLDKADLEPRMLERAIRYAILAADAVRSERVVARMQAAVVRAARTLLDVLDHAGLPDQVVRAAVEELGAEAAWLGHARPDGTIARVASFPETFPEVVPLAEAPDGTAAERALRRGKPVIVDVMGAHGSPAGSAAVFPLVTPDGVAGVLTVYSHTPRFFTVPVIDAFATFTAQAALAFRAARLQEQVHQAIRTEAIGRLAGGVAHEFNNLLMTILGHTELALEGDVDAQQRALLEEIQIAAQRAVAVTRHLLAFGRRQVLVPEVLDVNELVAGIQPLLAHVVPGNVHLVTLPSEVAATASLDRGQIEHALANLAMNARDAMPAGGFLVIAVQVIDVQARRLAETGVIVPGKYVELSVTDTGTGMNGDTRRHAFEPFFTTKAGDEGVGLGLASVLGVVQQSGGRVVLESAPGRGTTVAAYFPCAPR